MKFDGEPDTGFTIKTSGEKMAFESGMVRDNEDTKTDFTNRLHGPMLRRWAEHLTKAKSNYPDVAPEVPNWTIGDGDEEYYRFRRSLFRHTMDYLEGKRDEDHAAAIFFNIDGAERIYELRQRDAIASAMASGPVDDVPPG